MVDIDSLTKLSYYDMEFIRTVEYGIEKIKDGKFLVVSGRPDSTVYPGFLHASEIGLVGTSEYDPTARRYISAKVSWGKFITGYGSPFYELLSGSPPEGIDCRYPEMWEYVEILDTEFLLHGPNGRIERMNLEAVPDMQSGYNYSRGILTKINRVTAAEIGVVFPGYLDKRTAKSSTEMRYVRITNDSVSVPGTFAITDRENQLVVAVLSFTDRDTYKAIKGSLATNNKNAGITIAPSVGYACYAHGMRQNPLAVARNLESEHASASVIVVANPAVGDPADSPGDFFYVIANSEEEMQSEFAVRLDKALFWPVMPEWAKYLISEGTREKLVSQLVQYGDQNEYGKFSIKVEIIPNKWIVIIQRGIASGKIKLGGDSWQD